VISEKDAALAVPPTGFVHDYMAFAMKQTTAPLGYHLVMALSLLGTTTPISYGTSYAGDLYGNLYALLVGRSGDEQKSSALGVAKKVLFKVQEQLGNPIIGKQPGSPEGLVDSLVAVQRQIIYYSEFGAFLAKAQRKGTYPSRTRVFLWLRVVPCPIWKTIQRRQTGQADSWVVGRSFIRAEKEPYRTPKTIGLRFPVLLRDCLRGLRCSRRVRVSGWIKKRFNAGTIGSI
jgi:hypothetical protein